MNREQHAFFAKLCLASLLFCSSSLWAQQRGDIVSYSYERSYTTQDVRNLLNNFGVPEVLIRPEFNVDMYKVVYETIDASGQNMTIASGALLVPQGVTCALPLASYQHGTTSLRNNVPSRGSAEVQLGLLYASAGGYITAMPDYLGMGDGPGFHPYVHAHSQATAVVDMLRAARRLQDSINYELNEQIFLFGYSQGGHATMAAFQALERDYSNEFTVTACAPMSGPYDISGIQSESITADSSYSTPGYLPYVILGYQEAYGNIYNDLSDIFISPYDTLIPDLFDGTNSIGYINSFLPDTPKHMINPVFYNDFVSNPNNVGRVALRDNDLYDWVPQGSLKMFYCRGDEQVSYRNSEFTYDTMRALGATQVFKQDFGNLDHGGCLPSCMLQGFFFFSDYRDVQGDLTAFADARGISEAGQSDGRIAIVADGFSGNLEVVWENGDTGVLRENLAAGTYVARVSDSTGCYLYVVTTVSISTGLGAVGKEELSLVFPNPTSGLLHVRCPQAQGQFRYRLYNTLGQVMQEATVLGQETQLQLGNYQAGLYILELEVDEKRIQHKVLLQQ